MIRIDPGDKGALKENVARRLKLVREVYQIGQPELVKRLGLTQPRYSMYETGDRLLPPHIAIKLCEEFVVTMDWLYRGSPDTLPNDLWQKIRALQSKQDRADSVKERRMR